jgi:hypothetical protein
MQTSIRHTVLALLILAITILSPGLGRAQTFTAEEVQKLKLLLQHIRMDINDLNGLAGPHIIIEGANVHVQSGYGATDDRIGGEPSGWGNLIIGYNEVSPNMANPAEARRGSHNLVIGPGHTYINVGGLVAGEQNTLLGAYASVSGGQNNAARAPWSSVSGGVANRAIGAYASVSGGAVNDAVGDQSSISGGTHNIASGVIASINGGYSNTASGNGASISGGGHNTASDQYGSDLNTLKPLVQLVADGQLKVEGALGDGLPGPNVVFQGVNVHVRNNAGRTESLDGLGNLIVGYNEAPED